MQEELFTILVNQDEQYSLWPADKGPPKGWRAYEGGLASSREACLALIESIWKDLRPLSLRQRRSE